MKMPAACWVGTGQRLSGSWGEGGVPCNFCVPVLYNWTHRLGPRPANHGQLEVVDRSTETQAENNKGHAASNSVEMDWCLVALRASRWSLHTRPWAEERSSFQ